MTLKKSIDRLYWRLKNGRWNPNQKDVEAVNEMVTYINNSKKKDIKENILFTKMYVFCFSILTNKYKSPEVAQEYLHRILEKKTIDIYQDYLDTLNTIKYEEFCEIVGLEVDYLKPLSKEYREEQIKIISENEEEFLKHTKGLIDFETIRVKLNDQVSEAFNKYNQKK